jgi:hypothetical protein
MTPDIELDIDELVLHGFAPGDRAGIAGAVQSELARLFAEHGVPARLNTSSMIPHLDGGSFPVAAGASPAGIGAQVARMVYGGLGQ